MTNGQNNGDEANTCATVGLRELFEACAELEKAQGRVGQSRAAVNELKERLEEAKGNLKAAAGAMEQAKDAVISLAQGMRPKGPQQPMGWIDERTRPGRKFLLDDCADRVEFRGIVEGHVGMFWAEGLLVGESFFPAGQISVQEWNEQYAGQVEGYVDPVELPGRTGVSPVLASDATGGRPVPQPGDDSWRAVKLADIDGIPPRVIRALAEHEPPITTLGELTNWQQAKGEFWAKDVKGLGPAAAGKLADAMERFGAKRRPSPPL